MLLKALQQLHSYTKYSLLSVTDYPSIELLLIQHAVHTPLSILVSCLNDLENSQHDNALVLKRARLALKHLQSVTHDISSSRKNSQRANIKQVVKNIICLLRSKNHNIIFTDITRENRICRVPINEVRLSEAFACLINNALAANGKSILPVHITYYKEKGRHRITIRDFGPGIHYFLQKLIYLPHVTFKDDGKGLGLYFAKQVIERELKGNLNVFSEPEQGTLVECLIPDWRQSSTQTPAL